MQIRFEKAINRNNDGLLAVPSLQVQLVLQIKGHRDNVSKLLDQFLDISNGMCQLKKKKCHSVISDRAQFFVEVSTTGDKGMSLSCNHGFFSDPEHVFFPSSWAEIVLDRW